MLSDKQKMSVTRIKCKWVQFCADLSREHEWKALIKSLNYENKGLAESIIHFLLRQSRNNRRPRLRSQNALRVYTKQLGALHKKFTDRLLEPELKSYLLNLVQGHFTAQFGLRKELKPKPILGPDLFTYLQHFLWMRSTLNFRIGLDRLDDSCLRLMYMFTGCRKHELVYTHPGNTSKLIKEYDEESDAYTDVEVSPSVPSNRPSCWVCDGPDEREDNPKLKVLCWEDIDFWILQDPDKNGGRDRLAMQVLLRFHKGENRKRVPTWFIFVEENLPILCPISHILAKALAEDVIAVANPGKAEPFFSSKIAGRGVKIRWKPEFLHKPVFRSRIPSLGGFGKKPRASLASHF